MIGSTASSSRGRPKRRFEERQRDRHRTAGGRGYARSMMTHPGLSCLRILSIRRSLQASTRAGESAGVGPLGGLHAHPPHDHHGHGAQESGARQAAPGRRVLPEALPPARAGGGAREQVRHQGGDGAVAPGAVVHAAAQGVLRPRRGAQAAARCASVRACEGARAYV